MDTQCAIRMHPPTELMEHMERRPTTTALPEPTAFRKLSPALTDRQQGGPPIILTPARPLITPPLPRPMAVEARGRRTTPTPEPMRLPGKVQARLRSGEAL